MKKTINELARDLNVSKTAIRKKIDKLGAKDLLIKEGNTFFINESLQQDIINEFTPSNIDPQKPDIFTVNLDAIKVHFFDNLIDLYLSDSTDEDVLTELYTDINSVMAINNFRPKN